MVKEKLDNVHNMEYMKPVFYAHSKPDEGKEKWQRLVDHLKNTAILAAKFGSDAGVAELAYIAALVHDLGKYSLEFQARLEGKKIRVDHSTAGARELYSIFKNTPQEQLALLLAYCIAGHHGGMPDYGDSSDLPGEGTLMARLKTEVSDYSAYTTELDLTELEFPKRLHIRPLMNNWGFSFAFLARMIYSALVDADFQETEEYILGKKPRGGYASIESLCAQFNDFVHRYDNPQREIDQRRTETLRACLAKAAHQPGFFTLTVPTGGGKTLASMAFGLNHASKNGMKRIIYVIPFTTIIEQNAAVFKEILGEENVLEHHSDFDWERIRQQERINPDNQTSNIYEKLKLAAENWDIPVVVTTNVQFFESLFANRSSRCRKLHNLAKSVMIFDEAQMMPREYLYPAMYAIWELVTNYGASAVFCTATQPNLGRFLPEGTELIELAPDPQALFDFYRRVEVKHLGKLNDDELLERLESHPQVLCIVNTRRHAKGLFEGIGTDGKFHLSTLMCPAHRRMTLGEIVKRIKTGAVCRVVSTSVMEAGIDLDFPVGYRALAGLDSINQAAGRVNREMRQITGKLFIFEPDSPFIKRIPKFIEQCAEVTRNVLRNYHTAPISIPAIHAYFDTLYSLKDKRDFDFKNILGCFNRSQPYMLDFESAAERFRVIEDNTLAVIIPYDEEAKYLIEELKTTLYPSNVLRKLQPYTVNIFEQEFETLSSQGAIVMIADKYAALYNLEHYHPETGLVVPASDGGDALFF